MSIISENIKFLRKRAGYTQEQFAQEVGIKRSVVGAYEEARAEPRLQTLLSISKVLNVTTDHLISQDLTTGKEIPQKDRVRILSITVDKEENENVELVPQKAAAGYLNGYSDPEYLSELPRFNLPMLPKNGTYRAFEIQGDSMLPLQPGSVIIGKYVESLNEVSNGKTYVVVTESEGVVYKRVFNYMKENGKLFLVSDNKSYAAYDVSPEDILEMWEAKAYISITFPDPSSSEELSIKDIAGMVAELKDEIKEIKQNI